MTWFSRLGQRFRRLKMASRVERQIQLHYDDSGLCSTGCELDYRSMHIPRARDWVAMPRFILHRCLKLGFLSIQAPTHEIPSRDHAHSSSCRLLLSRSGGSSLIPWARIESHWTCRSQRVFRGRHLRTTPPLSSLSGRASAREDRGESRGTMTSPKCRIDRLKLNLE